MKTTNATLNIIKCPHCGYEYLPEEIFIPDSLLGHSTKVVREASGKIIKGIYKPGLEPDNTESFICENCNKNFIVEATVSFKTKVADEELDFDNQEASLL